MNQLEQKLVMTNEKRIMIMRLFFNLLSGTYDTQIKFLKEYSEEPLNSEPYAMILWLQYLSKITIPKISYIGKELYFFHI